MVVELEIGFGKIETQLQKFSKALIPVTIAVSSLAINISLPPALVKMVEPIVIEGLEKTPVTYTCSEASRVMEKLASPPAVFAHTKLPEPSNLETKIALPPTAVKLNTPAPGSKSAVPSNQPVV